MSCREQELSGVKSQAWFLRGSIEAGELSKAILDEKAATEAMLYASPARKPGAAKKQLATKEKTCKPTRNPCCKVEGTKEKTCKPTRNPCCKPTADTKPACCKVEGTKEKTCKATRSPCCKVEGTKEKTCKPTRNPCCKPTKDTKPACCKKAQDRREEYFGGAPVERLFI